VPAAPTTSLVAGFVALAVALGLGFVALCAVSQRRLGSDAAAVRRTAMGAFARTALWMGLTATVATTGALARFDARPPPILVLFVGVFAVSGAVSFSRLGGLLARGLPVAVLVAAQSFRLPLELLLHEAAREGVMPVQMSFAGWNFDIVTGASAVVVATLAALGRAPRALILAWNTMGMALLATILGIAIASTPALHAFGDEPRRLNTFVAHFPFVWLPSVCVVAAWIGHVVLLRKLTTAP
jgi:hypothetical protein